LSKNNIFDFLVKTEIADDDLQVINTETYTVNQAPESSNQIRPNPVQDSGQGLSQATMLPSTVALQLAAYQQSMSKGTFLFKNIFKIIDFSPFLIFINF